MCFVFLTLLSIQILRKPSQITDSFTFFFFCFFNFFLFVCIFFLLLLLAYEYSKFNCNDFTQFFFFLRFRIHSMEQKKTVSHPQNDIFARREPNIFFLFSLNRNKRYLFANTIFSIALGQYLNVCSMSLTHKL